MTIRWNDHRRPRWTLGGREAWEADRVWDDAHPGHALICFGRCRSGRRWFWAVCCVCEDGRAYGWTETEQQALTDMRAAVERLAEGRDAVAVRREDVAASRLKELNAAKRAVRPAPDTAESKQVEYLYCICWPYDEPGPPWVEELPIVKKTKQRVYYHKFRGWIGDDRVGFVDRQKLEARGEIWSRAERERFYLRDPRLDPDWNRPHRGERYQPDPAHLAKLKQEMAAAHPDKGGSNAAFIEARRKYVEARRIHRREKMR
jgi:hypothetical protein